MEHLSTSTLVRASGVHPNTVRRYAERGFLPPVERSLAVYRRFTGRHLDCLRLTRLVFSHLFPGRAIYESGIHSIHVTAGGDLGGALELAYRHLALVQSDRAQAARLLGISIDIPRDQSNGYRLHGAQQLSCLRLIRMLSRAGYGIGAILRMLLQLDRGIPPTCAAPSTPLAPTKTYIWLPIAG